MGTRNLVAVVSGGEYKVAQYGQWDGYPDGQGAVICDFLQNKMDLEKFRAAVNSCKFLTDDEVSQKWADAGADMNDPHGFVSMDVSSKFKNTNPTLSRDVGAKVLEMIQDGARDLKYSLEFVGDSLFCEWAYVIDLDNQVLEVYQGFNTKPLDPTERFYFHAIPEEPHRKGEYYHPVKLVKKLTFSETTKDSMTALSKELNKNAEE